MEQKIRQIITEILEINAKELSATTDISTLETWDSLAQVRLIAEIEDVLQVSIPIEVALSLKTIQNLIDVVSQCKSSV